MTTERKDLDRRISATVEPKAKKVKPAVARPLQVGRAALHVVLGVEVRPRLVVRSAGVHDRQFAPREERVQRRHAGVQPEEPIDIDGAV